MKTQKLYECMIEMLIDGLIKEKWINNEDVEIYRFGIDVTLLKILHFLSYLVIAFSMSKVAEYIIIFTVFIMLRKSVGGYHAKTRVGCYFFSCAIVIVALIAANIQIKLFTMNVLAISEIIILLMIAPVQHKNRKLDKEEKAYARKQLFLTIMLLFMAYIGTGIVEMWNMVWLYVIGLSVVTFSAIVGKVVSMKW